MNFRDLIHLDKMSKIDYIYSSMNGKLYYVRLVLEGGSTSMDPILPNWHSNVTTKTSSKGVLASTSSPSAPTIATSNMPTLTTLSSFWEPYKCSCNKVSHYYHNCHFIHLLIRSSIHYLLQVSNRRSLHHKKHMQSSHHQRVIPLH